MIKINKLKAIIVENGYSQSDVAKHLGITRKTFYDRMKKGVFDSDEMQQMIDLLCIKNPEEIFFD